MLGTVLLIGTAVLGFLKVTPWLIAPATIMAGFIGLHYPPGKAQMMRDTGRYWPVFFMTLPLQGALIAALYGAGRGIAYLLR